MIDNSRSNITYKQEDLWIIILNYGVHAQEFLQIVNKVRADPTSLIPGLEKMLKSFNGKVYVNLKGDNIRSKEGSAVVQETIDFLKKQTPVPTFKLDEDVWKVSQKHCDYLSTSGKIEHESANGDSPFDRLKKAGIKFGGAGENIGWAGDPMECVIGLIVDDGVPSRGHRKNIFKPDFKSIGFGYNKHKIGGNCVVMNFTHPMVEGGSITGKDGKAVEFPEELKKKPPGWTGMSQKTSKSSNGKTTTYTFTAIYKFKDGKTETKVKTVTV